MSAVVTADIPIPLRFFVFRVPEGTLGDMVYGMLLLQELCCVVGRLCLVCLSVCLSRVPCLTVFVVGLWLRGSRG